MQQNRHCRSRRHRLSVLTIFIMKKAAAFYPAALKKTAGFWYAHGWLLFV
jgi:hypothetical protein